MLVRLARFVEPWEAQVVAARLNADDIPATVAYANHSVMAWPLALALGGTAIEVPASHLAQAREVLARYQSGELEAELDELVGVEPEQCPRCGSADFRRTMSWHRRLLAVMVNFLFVAFPAKRDRLICNNCGTCWKE